MTRHASGLLWRGIYSACMLAFITGCVPGVLPEANFTTGVRTGEAPLAVVFGDASKPGIEAITAWEWNLGDGQTASTPIVNHLYQDVGKYTVSLTVSDSVASDTETKTEHINVFRAAVPDFTAFPITGNVPLTVTFTNATTPGSSPLLSLFWDFGDGETSSETQPTHTYDKRGVYTVYMYAIDENGARAERKKDLITVE